MLHMNQSILQCGKEHWYTYISNYWHMLLNKYACDIAHICSMHYYLVYIKTPHYCKYKSKKRKKQSAAGTSHIFAKYVPERYISLKCHMYAIYANEVMYRCIYTSYALTAINGVIRSTVIHTITLFVYAPQHICLPHLTSMCYCTNTAVYM